MSTVHFAYAVFDSAGYLQTADGSPPWRDAPAPSLRWPIPVHAPYSITQQILLRLQEKYKVRLYDIAERCCAELAPDDVFLGHLYPKTGSFGGKGMIPDLDTVGWRTLARYGCRQTCVIQPFVYCPEIVEMDWLSDAFGPWCDSFVAICGEYWEKLWWESPLSKSNRNFLRINMCIDPASYPWVRKQFRPKGERRFLYIGHNGTYKNTAQLEAIARHYPGFQGGCLTDIKGWIRLSDRPLSLTPQLMSELAEHFDVFLSTSTGDAQATTILEQMAAGFPVACTPQSGYERPSIIKLDPHDTEFNLHQIDTLQKMDEEDLMALARTNRRLVETEYTWDYSIDKLIRFIDHLLSKTSNGKISA